MNSDVEQGIMEINYIVIIIVMPMPLISVIISAHDRRSYIKEALESCLNQSFPRDNYEVIVVKNFTDVDIDAYIAKYKVESILTDKITLGQKMAAGIEKSSGSVICFLDDDDKFTQDKLAEISNSFNSIKNLGYFHNGQITIDEAGNVSKKELSAHPESDILIEELSTHAIRKARKYNGDWFMSCISVSRDLALRTLPLLKEQKASFDKLFFYNSMLLDMKMMISSKKLTYYRLHPSMTTIVDEKGSFFEKKIDFFLSTSNALLSIIPQDKNSKRNLLELAFLHEAVNYSVLSGKKIKLRDLIKYMRLALTIGTSSDQKWALLYILNMISHNLARNIYFRTMSELYS
jgi:glycosyltransferase involved in cell wall biosynthesis